MEATPQFSDHVGRPSALISGVLCVYIDDFGGWAVLPRVEEQPNPASTVYRSAESDLAAVRSRLTEVGLGCDKELIGLPKALGYQVVKRPAASLKVEGAGVSNRFRTHTQYFLKGEVHKLFPLNAFTVLTLHRNVISPQNLAQLSSLEV